MLASDEEGGTLDELRFSLATDIVELVVLTTDEIFLQTLREAVGGSRRLWHVPSSDKVSDLLVAGEVGILVLDVQSLNEAATVFVGQIKRQFPDLVVVVAGNRDAEISLAGQISAGIVYRFIHKPMSPGRTLPRMALRFAGLEARSLLVGQAWGHFKRPGPRRMAGWRPR